MSRPVPEDRAPERAAATTRDHVAVRLSPLARLLHDVKMRWGTLAPVVLVTITSLAVSLLVTKVVLQLSNLDAPLHSTVLTIAAIVPVLVAPPVMIAFSELIDHLYRMESDLRHQASHDPLTGLPNRRAIIASFQDALRSPASPRAGTGVLMLDVDHFKSINDRFGHMAGDRTLAAVAAALRGALRRSDSLGRYGGEEFLAVTGDGSPEALLATAERLCAVLRAMDTRPLGVEGPVTVSIGGAIHLGRGDDATIDAMLKRADAALYRAKRLGRDRADVAQAGEGTVVDDDRISDPRHRRTDHPASSAHRAPSPTVRA